MHQPVRRRLAAASLAVLLPGLAACGFGVQTNQVYQPAVGANVQDEAIDILNAVVVSDDDGSGTFVASLVNTSLQDDDQLTGITGQDVEVQLSEPVDLRADGIVNLADAGVALVTGDQVTPGLYTRLTLEFASGQQTEINVPIVAREQEFADITPAEPSPSASPSDSASPSSSESPSPSAEASQSPSP